METKLLIAILGFIVTIFTGIIIQFIIRSREINLQKFKYKIDRYSHFLSCLSEANGPLSYEVQLKLSNSINTLNLFASEDILKKIYDYIDQSPINEEDSAYFLNDLINTIRDELGVEKISKSKDFNFKFFEPEFIKKDLQSKKRK